MTLIHSINTEVVASSNTMYKNLNNIKKNNNNNLIDLQEEIDNLTCDEKLNTIENNDINSLEENDCKNVITYTSPKGEAYEIIGRLNIPSLNINYSILSKTSDELLNISLNKYWGANPNEVGNMVVLGHNYKNNKFFGKLPNIQKGAIVEITDTNNKTLQYSVYDTSIIDPYDNSCTSQLTDGHIEITLITCYYENGNSHATKRFVVKARAN